MPHHSPPGRTASTTEEVTWKGATLIPLRPSARSAWSGARPKGRRSTISQKSLESVVPISGAWSMAGTCRLCSRLANWQKLTAAPWPRFTISSKRTHPTMKNCDQGNVIEIEYPRLLPDARFVSKARYDWLVNHNFCIRRHLSNAGQEIYKLRVH